MGLTLGHGKGSRLLHKHQPNDNEVGFQVRGCPVIADDDVFALDVSGNLLKFLNGWKWVGWGQVRRTVLQGFWLAHNCNKPRLRRAG